MEIVRLVPEAATCSPPSYDWPSVAPDGSFAIVKCDFGEESGRPTGFYRASLDGDGAQFVAAGDIHTRMTPDGEALYTLSQGDGVLKRAEIATGQSVDVCDIGELLPEGFVYAQMRLCPTADQLYVMLREPDIIPIRVDVVTGEAVRLDDLDGMVWACMGHEPRLVVIRQKRAEPRRSYSYLGYRKLELEPGDRSIWSVDMDGGDDRLICVDYYSHATMLGGTSMTQGCGKWGDNAITVCGEGDVRRKWPGTRHFE